MFQWAVNNMFEQRVFNNRHVVMNRKIHKKFVHHNGLDNNQLTQYLMNTNIPIDLDTFLISICYNISVMNQVWNQDYVKVSTHHMDTTLVSKLKQHIPCKDVYDRICDYLTDYYIMGLCVDDYDDVWHIIGYLETFPTLYLTCDLTDDEIAQINNICTKHNILINTPDNIKLVRPSAALPTVIYFTKTPHDIIRLILRLANSDIEPTIEQSNQLFPLLKINL